MEWLPPTIDNPALLELAGAILRPNPTPQIDAELKLRVWRPEFHWPELIAFAGQQDILPPLIWALKTRHLLLPIPKSLSPEKQKTFITTRLNEAFGEHAARQSDLRAQLYACVAAMNRVGVTPMLLKGARYLLEPDTQWGAARPMRDIDMLILPEQAEAAIGALVGIGYVADAPSGLISHHLPELRMPGRHGVVELHTEALASAGAKLMPTSWIWQIATAMEVPGAMVRILPAVWQSMHAMLHHQVSDDGYEQCLLALKPLWEFSCLAAGFSVEDWADLAGRPGIIDYLASWCLQTERIFQLAYPTALPVSKAAQAQTERCFLEAAQPEYRRRTRFLSRQLRRGFSREVMALRYGVPQSDVGLKLRARHAWFLLRRYRFTLGARLFGPA